MITNSLRAQTTQPYTEAYRPQFHFTADKGWLNDPNGMVYYQGEYHLFFQRTPDSLNGGLKSWGHAVSTDLVHWKQLGDALAPDKLGDIWSGSAVVDWNNTAGFQTGAEKPLIAMYTVAGKTFAQCLAYSNDRGRTWTKYADNPVIPHINAGNRDPKLIWYEATKKWIVVIYLDRKNDYTLFTSPDLKHWTQIQTVSLPNSTECPDFFPLNLDEDPSKPMWILTGASGRYMSGSFDGSAFTGERVSHEVEFGANCYAAQTFSDIPSADGRRIQIGWMNDGKYPGMPFNQQMGFPCELTLRSTPDGPRIFKYPVKEIDSLHGQLHDWKETDLSPDTNPLAGIACDCLDIAAVVEVKSATKLTLNIRGTLVEYDSIKHSLSNGNHASLQPIAGRIKLRIIVDRTSIEVFGNDGSVAISRCFVPSLENRSISLNCDGGIAQIVSMKVYEMKSAWQ